MMIRAKKSLGQNFLKSKKIAWKMVESLDLKEGDFVLEIGPGKGALTEILLKKNIKLILIEKDKRMVDFLEKKFLKEIKTNKLKIIEGDVLKIDFLKIDLSKNYKLIANLPYYITGKFLSKIFSLKNKPALMILMLQKEVIKRIVSDKGSLLSLSVKLYSDPKYLFSISKKNFSPIPKVDSAIIKISNINNDFFKEIKEKDFFIFLKQSFSNKRKTLFNNLKKKYDKEKLEKIFNQFEIDLKIRAEDLKVEDFKKLYLSLKK